MRKPYNGAQRAARTSRDMPDRNQKKSVRKDENKSPDDTSSSGDEYDVIPEDQRRHQPLSRPRPRSPSPQIQSSSTDEEEQQRSTSRQRKKTMKMKTWKPTCEKVAHLMTSSLNRKLVNKTASRPTRHCPALDLVNLRRVRKYVVRKSNRPSPVRRKFLWKQLT